MFQSTPPRGGRHHRGKIAPIQGMFQSTPPRGGRQLRQHILPGNNRVQSTPPRGGRLRPRRLLKYRRRFQSTPPRGGRPCILRDIRGKIFVSIHAPTRGATKIAQFRQLALMFQSTPPRGGRRWRRQNGFRKNSFNPRPHAGGDARRLDLCGSRQLVSIHAPTRGATHIPGPGQRF